ncbi:Metacaspase-1 [Heracleum sosnowskyi]|uniref:Metacaspase-1 n=1 Tax=Heracleum sosnowskyi TaxID=360622 RepID=A0AAD8GYF7_9APIA|nr:Metacaspase-1 [Heracleum sosnowskyi]
MGNDNVDSGCSETKPRGWVTLNEVVWKSEATNQAGDSLVFYYTGHGSKERDFDGDEIDGFDKVLCPVDYQSAGKITDDEINATIVRPLPPGAKLHGIIDCCFSGTVLDLPFLSKTDSKGATKWVDQRIQYAAYKGTSGGIAISISACTDHHKSGDTTAFTGISTGALNYSFIQALTKQPNITYGSLLIGHLPALLL